MGDGPSAGELARAQLSNKIAKLALCKVRIPRHHDELVEGGKRRSCCDGRFDEDGVTDRAAPPRQLVGIRHVTDLPFDC